VSENPGRRFVEWAKSQFGLKTNVLRPVPDYSLNPMYWLGALTAIAFGLQVLTGLLMMIYYVPSTDQAYSSTLFIIQNVPLGSLLETVHLYGAYAMILLALLHLFRGYFVSVQKKPRQMMWVVGMLMGLITLGLGLTGYLLPWTVVSKSATDVSVGMLGFLPAQIGPILIFLIAGAGGSATELTRFFDLHVIVLPAGLLSLLALKMFMFEAHGPAEPVTKVKSSGEVPWFPTIYLYFAMIGSVFIAILFATSALFPIQLAQEYTPAAAANYVPQPEWYFLWIYQILKFASFEGPGIYTALALVTILVAGLILLPFLDIGKPRNPKARPFYTAVGLVLIGELAVLTLWGYLTPGQVITDASAAEVIGTSGIAIAAVTLLILKGRIIGRIGSAIPPRLRLRTLLLPFTHQGTTALFAIPLIIGSVSMANVANSMMEGVTSSLYLAANSAILIVSFYVMLRMMRSLTQAQRRSGL
jgi:quinol-cytochrome oxidoreductase complex cytochrome b subunit